MIKPNYPLLQKMSVDEKIQPLNEEGLISKEEREFYSIFPAIQYLLHRGTQTIAPKGYQTNYDLSSKTNGRLDYQHLVFINEQKKEVIYSIKGTYWGDYGDIISDFVLGLGTQKMLTAFNKLRPLMRNNIYEIASNIITKYKINSKVKYKIIFASHSLGATLQQILLMSDYVSEQKYINRLRYTDNTFELNFNPDPDNDKKINIYEYVDKVYAFDIGIGLFDGIVAHYNKLTMNPKQISKLKEINNLFYVPSTQTTMYDISAQITDREGLERIFIGNIQRVSKRSEDMIAHSIYNYANEEVLESLKDIPEGEKRENAIKKIKEYMNILESSLDNIRKNKQENIILLAETPERKTIVNNLINELKKDSEIIGEVYKDIDIPEKYLLEVEPNKFNYTMDDIRYLIGNDTKNKYINELIEKNKDPLLVYTVKTDMSNIRGKNFRPKIRMPEIPKVEPKGPLSTSSSSATNPQSGIPVTHSLRGSDGASSRGASTVYYEDFLGDMGTSTAGSVYGSHFEDVAPPDVYARYVTKKGSQHPISRATYAPETEIVTKVLFDSSGKPIVDLSGKPIITKEKVIKERKRKAVSTIAKGGEPKKAPAIPKIVKPKPKVEKAKASTTKPKPISKKVQAVPTVPKPKKEMKDKTIVKKTKTKVDTVYKM